jgi:hypothetical protein
MNLNSRLIACTHPTTNLTAYIQDDGEVFITDALICDILDIDQEHLDMLIARCDDPNLYNRIKDHPELSTIGGIQRISALRNAIDFVAIVRVWNPISAEDKDRKEDMIYEMAELGVIDYFNLACGRGDLARPFENFELEDEIDELKETIAQLQAANEQAIKLLETLFAKREESLDLSKTLVAEKKRKSSKH